MFWYRQIDFWFSTHTRRNFGRHYASLNQSVGHEDGKVESIKKSPNSPSKFGYSKWTASGETKCQFEPFCSRCNKTIVERVQRCLCVDVQGSKRCSTSFNTSLNEFDTNIPTSHQAWYQMNLNYVVVVKQDLDKLLIVGFVILMEEATWLSPIVVVPKNNEKLRIYVDF